MTTTPQATKNHSYSLTASTPFICKRCDWTGPASEIGQWKASIIYLFSGMEADYQAPSYDLATPNPMIHGNGKTMLFPVCPGCKCWEIPAYGSRKFVRCDDMPGLVLQPPPAMILPAECLDCGFPASKITNLLRRGKVGCSSSGCPMMKAVQASQPAPPVTTPEQPAPPPPDPAPPVVTAQYARVACGIVSDLAKWSLENPAGRVYPYKKGKDIDAQLLALEGRAVAWAALAGCGACEDGCPGEQCEVQRLSPPVDMPASNRPGPQYVLGFAFNKDFSQVALIRKEKPAWQKGKLNGIGGRIEPGETPGQAMAREFREETGSIGYPALWSPFGLMDGGHDPFSVFLFARQMETLEFLKSPTEEKVCIVTLECVHGMVDGLMVENLPWLIALAIDHLEDGRPSSVLIRYP